MTDKQFELFLMHGGMMSEGLKSEEALAFLIRMGTDAGDITWLVEKLAIASAAGKVATDQTQQQSLVESLTMVGRIATVPSIRGKKNGKLLVWYENGQKQREESYKNDERHGKWIYWFDNGRLEKEEKYSNGVQTDGKHYDYFDNQGKLNE